jgi:outer membrane protein assembly factor BamA
MGNHHIRSDELLDALLLFGEAIWMVPASIIKEELTHIYHAQGFLQVQFELHEDDTHYTCVIDEGERAHIDRMVFNHVHVYPHERLVANYGKTVLHHYYSEQAVQQLVRDIIALYNRDGFLDVRMVKTSCIPHEVPTNYYTLALTIDEGTKAYITAVVIDQFPELSSQSPFASDTPLVCTQNLIEEQRLFLVEYCQQAGYPDAQVYPELARVHDGVHVHWKIAVRKDARRFGKTILVTDTRFHFDHIIRELRYQEGEPWDAYKVKESLDRLKALDIFESVHLYPQGGEHQRDEQPLILKLYEDDPYEIRTRLGFGLQQLDRRLKFGGVTYIIGGSFIARNLGNQAGIMQLDADVTRLQRNFQLRYTRPWLFNMPIKTMLQAYSNHYWQPGFVGIRTKLYEVVQQGALVGFSRSYNEILLGLNMGIDGVKTVMAPGVYAAKIAHAINFAPRLVDKTVAYLLLEPTLVANYVDDTLQPRQGSLTVASLKGVIPLNRRHEVPAYLKFLLEQSLFIPIDPLVIALRARVGHIFRSDFSSLMPSDRFYLGGANSVRSYESDLCPPLGIFENDKGKKQVVPQGGKTMVNINVEIRFPPYKNIGIVAFQDLGLLTSNKLTEIHAKNILAGTGAGLRLNTPIGPLRFDIGWKWKCDDPFTANYAWFLTFGHAF